MAKTYNVVASAVAAKELGASDADIRAAVSRGTAADRQAVASATGTLTQDEMSAEPTGGVQQVLDAAEVSPYASDSVQSALDMSAQWQEYDSTGTGDASEDEYVGTKLGLIESSMTPGLDVFDTIDKKQDEVASSTDVRATVDNTVRAAGGTTVQDMLDYAASSGQPDVVTKTIEKVTKLQKSLGKPWALETMANTALMSHAIVMQQSEYGVGKEITFTDYAAYRVNSRLKERNTGLLRKGVDLASVMFATPTTVRLADFTDKFDVSTIASVYNTLGETAGRVLNLSLTGKGYDAYKTTVEAYAKMDPETRLFMFDTIEKQIDNITKGGVAGGNEFVYMALMAPFGDPKEMSNVKLDYALDSITIGTWMLSSPLKALVKTINRLGAGTSAITTLVNTGKLSEAAKMYNRAMSAAVGRTRAEKVYGKATADIVNDGNPFDLNEVGLSGIQDNRAAREAAEQLEKEVLEKYSAVAKEFDDILNPNVTPQRFYFDDAAKLAKEREVIEEAAQYPNFARVIDRTEDGFTVEVTTASKYDGMYDPEALRDANTVLERQVVDTRAEIERLRTTMPDEEFGTDPTVVGLRNQRYKYEDQIKKNNKIIKDIENPKTSTEKIFYGYDEFGQMASSEIKNASTHVNSPAHTVEQLLPGQVEDATLAEFLTTKIRGNLLKAVMGILRGVGYRNMAKIDALLLEGDRLERVFSLEELVGGVMTKKGFVKLGSKQEIAAYSSMRKVWDDLHRVKDYTLRRALEVGGFKALDIKGGIRAFAKQDSALASIPTGIRRIYDHKVGKVVAVDVADLTKRLAKNEKIVTFRNGVQIGDEIVHYGVVRPERDLKQITKVLNRVEGYVPRVRPSVFAVVTRVVDAVVDGNKVKKRQVVGLFNEVGDANAWVAKQEDPTQFSAMLDQKYRQLDPDFDDAFDGINFGGWITGARTDRNMIMGLDGKEVSRVSSYKALQMYISHIANRYSTNELKMSLIGKFQNSWGKYLTNPTNWRSPLTAETQSNFKLANAIEAQRSYIEGIIGIPDHFQQWWAQKMTSLAAAMEGKSLFEKIRPIVAGAATTDPTAIMRSMAFHSLLGFWRPDQLLVQGLGAATALFAHPGNAVKVMGQAFALRAAWYARHSGETVKTVAKWAGLDAKWLQDTISEIEKTGLFDSLKTTADYEAAANGISMSGEAVRRAMDSGIYFFREGEMNVRSMSYLLARDLFLSKKKKGHVLTQKDIDFIAKDSLRFTLNLNKSNAAMWQKGVLSIPTQFMQVSAKFMENMIAGTYFGKTVGVQKWTEVEKLRILAGYSAMFGLAGVPLGESIVQQAIEAKKKAKKEGETVTVEEINPFNGIPNSYIDDATFARFLEGGLAQVYAHMATGADVDIASRVSIPANIQESLDMFKSGDKTLYEALLGAFGGIPTKAAQTAKTLGQIFAIGRNVELTDAEMKMAVFAVAKNIASFDKATKAYWWYKTNGIRNAKGELLFKSDDEEFNSLLLWQSLGFAPADIGRMYDMQDDTSKLKGRVKERVNEALKFLTLQAPTVDSFDTDHNKDVLNFMFSSFFEDLSEQEKAEAIDLVIGYLGNTNEPKLYKVIKEYINATTDAGGEVTGSTISPLLIPEDETK